MVLRFYRESGLLGLSGLSNDMRTLEAADTPEARQAIDYFVFRCQREVGAMAAALGGIDALVFCGGIGEHSSLVRARICERLGWMGIEIDHARNAANERIVSTGLARTRGRLAKPHHLLHRTFHRDELNAIEVAAFDAVVWIAVFVEANLLSPSFDLQT